MAQDTSKHYRNLILYEIYVRNHGPNGTFADVEADLPRIQAMGVDVAWFMPIHPIGKVNKKGSLGCPYSIADYGEVNPEYGTKADFSRLIERAHALGLKVMIDVVYNHTAHDSVLVRDHPDWFHQDAHGTPVTTVPEWSDVIDLKHPNPALTDYFIETLQMWVEFGVDGFRCDVASLLPLDFWLRARASVAEIKPGVIWLAESVHAGWVAERRAAGLPMLSDCELYRAFDLTYDHDIWPIWQAAVVGKVPVQMKGEFVLLEAEPAIQAAWMHSDGGLYGVFNVAASGGKVAVRLPDDVYVDLLSDTPVEACAGQMPLPESALIVRYEAEIKSRLFYSTLLDYHREAR
ncbi:MAG: alpha-amylase family glycosyl hydrolase [Anaerolineae bacterium]